VSVFAAFVAAVSSMYVLYAYWKKKKHGFDGLLALTRPHPRRPIKILFKELLSYALPFAIISLSATWFQTIDTMTFNAGMLSAGVDPELAEGLFGIFITALLKVVMIPVSFSIAFGQPLIPEITEKIRMRDFKGVHQTLTSAIMLTSFITIPAVIGISMLSNPIFVLLFNTRSEEMNVLGGAMFGTGAFIALFMALNSIIAAIIQGVDRQFKSLIFLLIATIIKLIGNLVLIPIFEFQGAVFSTILAYAFCSLMNYLEIRKTTGIQTRIILRRHISIFIFTGLMALSVWLTTKVLDLFLDYTSSSGVAALYVIVAGVVGVFVYAGLAIYFDRGKMLFGDKLSFDRIKASTRFSRKS
jgi:O-antigen/teichoic acid export membrane protein